MALHVKPENYPNLAHHSLFKFNDMGILQNFQNGKMQNLFCLQSSSPKLLDRIRRYCTQIVLRYDYLKVCSNDGANYIIKEIKSKDNLSITNLMQTFKNLL